MKKTYLIKDQGKGLVENITPDKLFDIANGSSSGGQVDNSNDYSVDEIEVGKFIYLNDNGNKVFKPIYRKVFQQTISTIEETLVLSSIGIDEIISYFSKFESDGTSYINMYNESLTSKSVEDIIICGVNINAGELYTTTSTIGSKFFKDDNSIVLVNKQTVENLTSTDDLNRFGQKKINEFEVLIVIEYTKTTD